MSHKYRKSRLKSFRISPISNFSIHNKNHFFPGHLGNQSSNKKELQSLRNQNCSNDFKIQHNDINKELFTSCTERVWRNKKQKTTMENLIKRFHKDNFNLRPKLKKEICPEKHQQFWKQQKSKEMFKEDVKAINCYKG
jgi:hypothetical protein